MSNKRAITMSIKQRSCSDYISITILVTWIIFTALLLCSFTVLGIFDLIKISYDSGINEVCEFTVWNCMVACGIFHMVNHLYICVFGMFRGLVFVLLALIHTILAIWVISTYYMLDDECIQYHLSEYPDLMVLVVIEIIYLYIMTASTIILVIIKIFQYKPSKKINYQLPRYFND